MKLQKKSAARVFLVLCLSGLLLSGAHHAFGDRTTKKKKKANPDNPLSGLESKQPDKELYDKAMLSLKKGKFDVARLQLQALLNTYPESEYQMRAKLGIGDSWYKEGGTAAFAQAESEYKDFETFFPTAPEAAEAQMRVADIYYKQMEKPDRDYSKAQRSEEEYRIMIQQYPESTLIPRARQRLREVQEVLAERQFEIGAFYAGRQNWPATIARLQTIIDTYPLYSQSDQALLLVGDAYMAEARRIQQFKGPEGMKAQLSKVYEDHAADAYDRILTRYPMAPRAADAKQRLTAVGRPIPTATPEAIAESQAEEQSRAQVTLRSRALLLVSHRPETLPASRVGEPDLDPPKPTVAPEITKASIAAYNAIVNPAKATEAPADAAAGGSATPGVATPEAGNPAESPAFANPPGSVDSGNTINGVVVSGAAVGAPPPAENAAPPTSSPAADASGTSGGPAVSTGTSSSDVVGTPAIAATANSAPALKAVGPENATPLPPVERPGEAPGQVNEAAGVNTGNNTTVTDPNSKVKAPKTGSEDSSSKKKKKGLKKLNPF